ncbi:D-alanyl-D-alanine carboxypeptidase/D-alanyl-D-alanine-endopeptidase [Nocardioides sp. TF02-7]|uniref:D-alanyl-D-alanine carboxypeptidase/D-alanyl-D-alanine endopeptidase n=1 Tax=Nocardioides sp. TF02-7 TaxID=2917724 RepID=UPI001F05EF55|nr:D-alanyl-D-alanine carboxypeptidase/D-alanyl-D-alanine-endopeptidase [Nocardioides sp. TF02-7]UMG93910.1 D-alanyl-D-alanine carboxypeptidase/D-alanyl-D-alanine-endopeptidase [Nocardioides sp. TF02-7]
MAQRDAEHVRRSGVRWLAALLALVVVAGVMGWRLGWLDRLLEEDDDAPVDPAAVAPPPEVDVPPIRRPRPVAPPADEDGPLDAAAVEAALAGHLADRDLGRNVLAAVGPLDGRGVAYQWSKSGARLAIPASTTKIVTSAAALFLLGADHEFETTTVLEPGGATPRLVLVGGGDPFLLSSQDAQWGTSTPATVSPAKADVATLARRTARALRADGVRRVRIGFDDSLFSGPAENPMWRADYVPDGVVSPISALWVDEGRSPTGWGRVSDPALTAAQAFARALAAAGVRVVGEPRRTVADPGASDLAAVSSAPLAQVVQRLLEVSDNEATEVLLRHAGLADQGDGSFVGGQRAVRRVLAAQGIQMRGSVLHDGSGLSRHNRMTPQLLLDVIRWAADDAHPDLRPVLTGLPVAGYTGSLAGRMDRGPAAGPGRVRAKTGTLTGVTSLAGIAVDLDGDLMVFALLADKVRKDKDALARIAMDNAASALGACRCGR